MNTVLKTWVKSTRIIKIIVKGVMFHSILMFAVSRLCLCGIIFSMNAFVNDDNYI